MLRALPIVLLVCWAPSEGSLLGTLFGTKTNDAQKCVNYGFRPGTDAFANCRLQLDLAKKRGLTICRSNGSTLVCQ